MLLLFPCHNFRFSAELFTHLCDHFLKVPECTQVWFFLCLCNEWFTKLYQQHKQGIYIVCFYRNHDTYMFQSELFIPSVALGKEIIVFHQICNLNEHLFLQFPRHLKDFILLSELLHLCYEKILKIISLMTGLLNVLKIK